MGCRWDDADGKGAWGVDTGGSAWSQISFHESYGPSEKYKPTVAAGIEPEGNPNMDDDIPR